MIRIFAACAANNEDLESQAVLEWSLRKHTKARIHIVWMQLSRDRASPFYSDGNQGWQTAPWTTPFSGFRWIVPELCRYQGQAIYMDSDIIILGDIAELWEQPIPAKKMLVARGGQRICVSKWNCALAETFVPPLRHVMRDAGYHRRAMDWVARHPERVEPFAAGDWNRIDLEPFDLSDPQVKALHYTGIPTQVQLKHALPRLKAEGGRHWFEGESRAHPRPDLQKLFDGLLDEAAAAGYGIERYRVEPFGPYQIRQGR